MPQPSGRTYLETLNILRPLSPHLPIYKPQFTLTFPISHRIFGAFLATIVLFFLSSLSENGFDLLHL
ncbi:hypothetical protein AB3S75_047559 [Citrus x aurantiifolia]